MKDIAVARLRELDELCENCEEARIFLQNLPEASEILNGTKVRNQIRRIAGKLGIEVSEASSYFWVQAYISACSRSFETFPSPVIVAQQFQVNRIKFCRYFYARAPFFDTTRV